VISLLVFDIDGSLTNGDIIYNSDNTTSKVFNVKDGLAISAWNKIKGKKTAFITGKKTSMVKQRAIDLGVSYVYQGINNKEKILKKILKKEKITFKNIAILGDDLNDYNMLNTNCLTFCPNDASFYIKDIVNIVLECNGGQGAGREMIEYILKRDPDALKKYIALFIKSKMSKA